MNTNERIRRHLLGKIMLSEQIGNMTDYSASWFCYDDKDKTIVLLNIGFRLQYGDWVPENITVAETFYDVKEGE